MFKSLWFFLLIVVSASWASTSLAAGSQKSAVFMVNTTVLPTATAEVKQPSELVVTSKDLEKGLVRAPNKDNPEGGQLQIKSNSPAGYTVTFSLQADMVKKIQSATLKGLSSPVTITPNSPASIDLPFTSSSVTYKLIYEFNLNKGGEGELAPGNYLWPILVTFQAR